MNFRRLPVILTVALFAAACSSAGGSPSVDPGASPSPAVDAPATRVEVSLTDALRIEPSEMTVPAGQPVTFVITNAGQIEHEFYLGDEAAQEEHEREMQSGGMMHDDPNGISVPAGETKELTFTFDAAGETLAGCHVVGHYDGGMKAAITITD